MTDDEMRVIARYASDLLRARDRRWHFRATAWATASVVAGLVIWSAAARCETIDGDRITIVDGDTIALPCDPARGNDT